jgi:hypothetical protein
VPIVKAAQGVDVVCGLVEVPGVISLDEASHTNGGLFGVSELEEQEQGRCDHEASLLGLMVIGHRRVKGTSRALEWVYRRHKSDGIVDIYSSLCSRP